MGKTRGYGDKNRKLKKTNLAGFGNQELNQEGFLIELQILEESGWTFDG